MAKKKKLSIYFTAGIPSINDTGKIAKYIQEAGADMMEIGIPYSDPVADGPIIQSAHQRSLENGMTIDILFEQLKEIKDTVSIPKILMGYFNPILVYGFERFCAKCTEVGISGLIIPDLPPFEFESTYNSILTKHNLNFSFLITPETTMDRIQYLDQLSTGFLYAVSRSSTTGQKNLNKIDHAYLEQFSKLQLKNPVLIGFGISTKNEFLKVSHYSDGAIIGSAFVKLVLASNANENEIKNYIHSIIN